MPSYLATDNFVRGSADKFLNTAAAHSFAFLELFSFTSIYTVGLMHARCDLLFLCTLAFVVKFANAIIDAVIISESIG